MIENSGQNLFTGANICFDGKAETTFRHLSVYMRNTLYPEAGRKSRERKNDAFDWFSNFGKTVTAILSLR